MNESIEEPELDFLCRILDNPGTASNCDGTHPTAVAAAAAVCRKTSMLNQSVDLWSTEYLTDLNSVMLR